MNRDVADAQTDMIEAYVSDQIDLLYEDALKAVNRRYAALFEQLRAIDPSAPDAAGKRRTALRKSGISRYAANKIAAAGYQAAALIETILIPRVYAANSEVNRFGAPEN